MKVSFTREEMLGHRRLVGGFEPLRTDCTVEDTAGTDIDALLEAQLRGRYLELLDTADVALLAPADIAADTAVDAGADGCSLLALPAACRRVLSVRLGGWECCAEVLPQAEEGRVRALQLNPFTASDASVPKAVWLSDGHIAAWPRGSVAESVVAVCDPGPEVYTLDERALSVLCESEYNPKL